MELATILATAFAVGLSGAMMPGPLLTVTIGESARRGFVAGPLLVLGHGILEGALVIALVMGLGAFLTIPVVSKIIAVIGGLFLAYMGWGIVREAWRHQAVLTLNPGGASDPAVATGAVPQDADLRAAKTTKFPLVMTGVLVSVSNPYWILWWATVGLGYIVWSLRLGAAGVMSFFTGHILSDLAWYSLVAAAVAKGRQFMPAGLYRGILLVCGFFLIFLGGSFIFWGFRG